MESQETTYPQLTPKDFTDETAHRINSLIRDLYEKAATASGTAEAAIKEARKVSAAASDNRTFLPPTVPPSDPSNVTLTIPDYGENFGLLGAWDAPMDTSSTTGYEWAAQYFQDAACTIQDSDVILLGAIYGADTVTAEAGPWPRPADADKYAKIAVRGVGSDNSTGTWAWSAAQTVTMRAGGSGYADTTPPDPTAVTVTVTDQGGNYGLTVNWTLPSPLGSARLFSVEAQFYSDSLATTPVSEWIFLGDVDNATTVLESGYWPRPTNGIHYVKARIRSLNYYNKPGNWVESSNIGSVGEAAIPDPPTSPSVVVTDKEGNYGLTSSWAAPAVSDPVVGYQVEARFYLDSGGTTADSDWIVLGGTWYTTLESGYWPRPTDVPRWVKIRVAAHNINGVFGSYSSDSALVKVDTLAAPPSPTSGTATVGTQTRGGVASFNFNIVITPNASPGTAEGYESQVQYYTDAACTTPESDWIPLGWVDPATLTLSTDYWPRPTETRWAILRVAAKNADMALSAWVYSGALTIAAGGLDLGEASTATIGPGLTVDGGALKTTARGLLLNYDLEYWTSTAQPKDWVTQGTAGKVTRESTTKYTGVYSAKLEADGVGNNGIYQKIAVRPGQVLRLSSYLYNDTGASRTGISFFSWLDGSDAYISGASSGSLSAGSWLESTITATAPLNAAYALVYPAVAWATIPSGAIYVDQVVLTVVEPLTGTDLARVNGILGLAGGSLSQEAKYGSNAKPIIIGSGAPSNADGRADGSYYIDASSSSKIYKKKSGAWTSIEVGDIVAGNFIGFTLTLNLNSVTTTINNASDSSVPGGDIYPGVKVTNNSSGEYAFVSHGSIGVNLTGNASYSIVSRTQIFLAYKSSGGGYPRVMLDNSSATGCGLVVYDPGTGAASNLRARVSGFANYGSVDVYGAAYGAGFYVDGVKVVQARQSAPTSPGSSSSTFLGSSAVYSGLSAGATYTSNEQGIINQLVASMVQVLDVLAETRTGYNNLLTAYNSLITKLNTSGHGLIS